MLDVIQKLLILQDRDRRIAQLETEIAHLDPERKALEQKQEGAQGRLDVSKHQVKQIESDRKKLELDAEAQKQLIEKYSLQQFQTKKNEEYRALAHEIETCKGNISKLEDQQLELMEKADVVTKEMGVVSKQAVEAKKLVQEQLAAMADREKSLRTHLDELKSDYAQLNEGVEEGVLRRYERLRKQKGGNTVVGIEHCVCGGCHMKLPVQIVISCQGQQELISCPNCARILYFSREMDLAVAD